MSGTSRHTEQDEDASSHGEGDTGDEEESVADEDRELELAIEGSLQDVQGGDGGEDVPAAADPEPAEDAHEVQIVGERSRAERDAVGRANAIVVD